jgi:hypothetical protein
MAGAGEILQDIGIVVLALLGIGSVIAGFVAVALVRQLRNPVERKNPRDQQDPHPHLTLVVSNHWVVP